MSNLRTIVTIAVPAVTALLGLLWYFGRRKQPAARRLTDPPDKNRLSSQTESSASDNGQIAANVSKSEALNSLTGNGGSNIRENPVSSGSLERTGRDCHSNCKGDNNSFNTASENLHAESSMTGSGDATCVEAAPVEDLIHETVVKSSFTESCSSDRTFNENFLDDSKVSESAKTPLQLIEESIITPIEVENVLAAPEFSSPKPEQTHTADMSQEITDKIDTESLSLNTPTNVSDNCVLNENKMENSENEVKDLNITAESGSEPEDQTVQQTEPLTRSWHEDIPENMTDLNENLSLNSPPEIDHCEQNIPVSSNSNSSTIHEAESSMKIERTESDQLHASDNIDSKIENQSNQLLSSPSSRTGLQTEKTSENNHSDSSSNCDNLSEASNDSGKGGSVQENTGTSPPDEDRLFEFNIPSDLCGLFIGTRGKTIKMISQQSGTKIRLQNNPYTRDYQICVIEGSQSAIDTACNIIKRKFPAIKYPGMDMTPAANPVIMPEIMQLSLPEGVSVDIVVSSIVDAGRIFVQQPTHPTYPSLDRLNTFMSQCYMQEGAVPDIPRPIEAGVICAAPMLNGWYRAQIMASHEDSDECDVKYVDYGGYSRVSSMLLKQIRSDFMTLPFEAIECYLANITPLDNEQYFSTEAAVVLEELTQGKLLQGQVVGRAEDGIPYIHVYQILGANSAVLVNREMVNRGVVRWVELME
ncbi:A-kinase anchor protein 1, mitochondrial-like [Mercenaria mercenaria]|uniref:A-kinase anchor protein 1, mitochondrial-like n=1 Tax=Mercenaria mercenaria TaxID=6596 RepID=UPI00234F0AF2|nr:A-kinase anchor protein 1, mitochondrial-like [Mercenaria mercenaria]